VDRDNNRSFSCVGTDVIPEHWAEFGPVGEEFVGTPFAEHPDAEETFKSNVNAKLIPWGKGPKISTTHVFTGLALVEDVESGEIELQPVRLSLQRTNVPAVRKWMNLRASKLRNRPFWDKTFVLETERNTYDKGMAFNLKVSLGRSTTDDEKAEALALAKAVMSGLTVSNEDADVEAPADTPKGGLAV
jgi:hypothetical protein